MVLVKLLLQFPLAFVTVTGEGPVIIKSLPSGAMEEQRIGFLKTNCSLSGEHPTFVRLSITVGCLAETIKGIFSPTGIPLPQLSNKVFLSFPFWMVTV